MTNSLTNDTTVFYSILFIMNRYVTRKRKVPETEANLDETMVEEDGLVLEDASASQSSKTNASVESVSITVRNTTKVVPRILEAFRR